MERDDPTFAIDPVESTSDHPTQSIVDMASRPVKYGGDAQQPDATYTPDDEDDESQAI